MRRSPPADGRPSRQRRGSAAGRAPSACRGQGSHASRQIGGIAELRIELDGLGGEAAYDSGSNAVTLAQLQRRHLVLPTGTQTRLDLPEPLSTPEPQEHSFI